MQSAGGRGTAFAAAALAHVAAAASGTAGGAAFPARAVPVTAQVGRLFRDDRHVAHPNLDVLVATRADVALGCAVGLDAADLGCVAADRVEWVEPRLSPRAVQGLCGWEMRIMFPDATHPQGGVASPFLPGGDRSVLVVVGARLEKTHTRRQARPPDTPPAYPVLPVPRRAGTGSR